MLCYLTRVFGACPKLPILTRPDHWPGRAGLGLVLKLMSKPTKLCRTFRANADFFWPGSDFGLKILPKLAHFQFVPGWATDDQV